MDCQAEKAKAMKRYRRLQNSAKLWRMIEVVVALSLLSWSSTRLPNAVKLAGGCLPQLSDYLFNPHINFLIGNVIIIVLVLLSRQRNAGNNVGPGDLYDEYVRNSEAHQRIVSVAGGEERPEEAAAAATPEAVETADDDRQIVLSENPVTQMQCDAVVTAIEEATKQIQRFQRTQSEKLKQDLHARPRRQPLRRSESEIQSRAVVVANRGDCRAISSFDTVDRLSNEEFRDTVEAFIAEQQMFLRAQKMADRNQ
ncbi:hypothetical protein NMG60_11016237 [Bertholletia excelsa]